MAQAAVTYITADRVGDAYDCIRRLKNISYALERIVDGEPGLTVLSRLLALELAKLEDWHVNMSDCASR